MHLVSIGDIMPSSRQSEAPLLYTHLTTRSSSYPKWILVKSRPLPIAIRRSDLGNDVCSVLLSSQRAVIVPPGVNNVADSLGWLLADAPFQVASCYRIVVQQLYFSCLPDNPFLHPFNTHLKIVLMAMMSFISIAESGQDTYYMVMESLKKEIVHRWGHRLAFSQFNEVILESYNYLLQVSYEMIHFFSFLLLLI
jgi:hypothetical protein